MSIDCHDREICPRCPALGGEVPFLHCRKVNRGLPCHRLVTCWHGQIDLAAFLRTHYTHQEIEIMSQPPESRLAIILNVLERVRPPQAPTRPAASDEDPVD